MNTELNPVFILGNPRSGTTLLRLMLDSHPEITIPPECGFLIWYYPKYKAWNRKNCNSTNVQKFISDLKKAKKIESWKLNFESLSQYILKHEPCDYSRLVNAVYSFYSNQLNKQIRFWGDKNNFYLNHIKEISEIFPKARFLHIIRDGRDVACSYKELNKKKMSSEFAPKLSNNIESIANEWKSNNEKITNNLNKFVHPNNFLSVKFEFLVIESETFLQEICSFLHIRYHSDMLEYYKNSKTYEPEEFLQWKAKTTVEPQQDRIGRFRHDLTNNEINTFNNIAFDLLKEYNYE